MRAFSSLVAGFIAASPLVSCHSGVEITGQFATPRGDGISGANVRALKHGRGLWPIPECVGQTTTDLDGNFWISCTQRPDMISALKNYSHPNSIYRHSDSDHGEVRISTLEEESIRIVSSRKE